jgi:hypothetical protein
VSVTHKRPDKWAWPSGASFRRSFCPSRLRREIGAPLRPRCSTLGAAHGPGHLRVLRACVYRWLAAAAGLDTIPSHRDCKVAFYCFPIAIILPRRPLDQWRTYKRNLGRAKQKENTKNSNSKPYTFVLGISQYTASIGSYIYEKYPKNKKAGQISKVQLLHKV